MNTTDPVDLEALRGFTEGEWATEPYCIYEDHAWLITSGTHHVAIAPDISRSPQKFANAALIAAAPSMHAELLARRARDAEVEVLVSVLRRSRDYVANELAEERLKFLGRESEPGCDIELFAADLRRVDAALEPFTGAKP